LLCNDAEQAELLAQEVEQVSTERKTEQQAILDEALAEIGERGWQDAPALTLGRQGWNHGIVGIVAGRLAEQFGKPVVVIGFEGEIGRGSVRGPAGARLHDALSEVSACLRRFGGHQAAAGLEVEQGRLEELRAGFEQAIARQASQPQVAVPETLMLEYQAGDDPRRVFADLMLLEPCGEANPRPELSLNARLIRAREVRGGHLKLELELDSGRRLSGFAVEQGKLAETLGEHVHVVGELRPDRYRGGDALEIRVRSVRSAPAVKSPPGKW
jgi:single-stranded-DNA-specific exonuclease